MKYWTPETKRLRRAHFRALNICTRCQRGEAKRYALCLECRDREAKKQRARYWSKKAA